MREVSPQLESIYQKPEQVEAIKRFLGFAATRPVETGQVLVDLETRQPVFSRDEDIRDSVEKLLETTSNGRELNYDNETMERAIRDRGYTDLVAAFQATKDPEEQRVLRRKFNFRLLGVLVERLEENKHPKRRSRVA